MLWTEKYRLNRENRVNGNENPLQGKQGICKNLQNRGNNFESQVGKKLAKEKNPGKGSIVEYCSLLERGENIVDFVVELMLQTSSFEMEV